MNRYHSRSADPCSYSDLRRVWWGFGYGSSVHSSSSKRDYNVAEPPRKLDLDGLTPFERTSMSRLHQWLQCQRRRYRSIDYKGKSQLKAEMFPNLSRDSAMWGFLNMLCKKLQKLALLNPQLYKLNDGQ